MSRFGYSYLRFHSRRLYSDQGAAFVICSALAVGAALAFTAWAIEANEVARTKQELHRLNTKAALAPPETSAGAPQLPTLNTVSLVAAIHRAAASSKVGADEVTYVLEDQPALPYVRYRARFSVEASYPTIRKLVRSVVDAETNTTLDGISCARSELKGNGPVCDIAISAFYKRAPRG